MVWILRKLKQFSSWQTRLGVTSSLPEFICWPSNLKLSHTCCSAHLLLTLSTIKNNQLSHSAAAALDTHATLQQLTRACSSSTTINSISKKGLGPQHFQWIWMDAAEAAEITKKKGEWGWDFFFASCFLVCLSTPICVQQCTEELPAKMAILASAVDLFLNTEPLPLQANPSLAAKQNVCSAVFVPDFRGFLFS